MTTDLSASPPENFRLRQFSQGHGTSSTRCMVWLHGSGERGTDLSLVSRYGLPAALTEERLTVSADVICPQLETELPWPPDRLAKLLAGLRERYESLALVGFSLGAVGVCELLARLGPQANVHVAIAPSGHVPVVANQRTTRLLAISGEDDPWLEGAEFLSAVRVKGGEADSAVMHGEGHYISESALAHPTLVAALASIGITFAWRPNEA